jgi:vacuolar protein sorting-associated protein 13A/C
MADNEHWRNLSGNPRTWYKPEWRNMVPMMFSRRTTDKTCCVKIANSQWSKPLTFSTQGVQGFLELLDTRQPNTPLRSYQLAGDIEASPNPKFWRTKIVTFSPRYILVNKMKTTLFMRQLKTDLTISLLPDEQIPFHWPDAMSTFLLQMRSDGDYNW